MNFGFDEDQETLRASLRRFLTDHCALEKTRPHLESLETFDPEVWKASSQFGWQGFLIGKEHGGDSLSGQGLIDLVVVAEEMGRVLAPIFLPRLVQPRYLSRETRNARAAGAIGTSRSRRSNHKLVRSR